jgi:hypothetical protein
MLRSGDQVRGQRAYEGLERGGGSPGGGGGGAPPSSEAESHPRGRSSPRARRDVTRGGVQPSSEAGLVSAALCLSSEAEFRSRTAEPTALVGRRGHQGRGPDRRTVIYLEGVLGLRIRLCFVVCESKWVSSGFLGDPYGRPRQ